MQVGLQGRVAAYVQVATNCEVALNSALSVCHQGVYSHPVLHREVSGGCGHLDHCICPEAAGGAPGQHIEITPHSVGIFKCTGAVDIQVVARGSRSAHQDVSGKRKARCFDAAIRKRNPFNGTRPVDDQIVCDKQVFLHHQIPSNVRVAVEQPHVELVGVDAEVTRNVRS